MKEWCSAGKVIHLTYGMLYKDKDVSVLGLCLPNTAVSRKQDGFDCATSLRNLRSHLRPILLRCQRVSIRVDITSLRKVPIYVSIQCNTKEAFIY